MSATSNVKTEEEAQERIALLAALVRNNGHLRRIINDAQADRRAGVFALIAPLVKFKVSGSLKRRFGQ